MVVEDCRGRLQSLKAGLRMNQSGPSQNSGGFWCPMCKKAIANVQEPAFPFCSDKCRLLDLGNWLDGKYNTSRPLDPSDEQSIDETQIPLNPPDMP